MKEEEEDYNSENILEEIDENENKDNNVEGKENENIENKLENKEEENIIKDNEEINKHIIDDNLQENKVIIEDNNNIKENKIEIKEENINKEENNNPEENKQIEENKVVEENNNNKIVEENNDNKIVEVDGENGGNNLLEGVNEEKLDENKEEVQNKNENIQNVPNINENQNSIKNNIKENNDKDKDKDKENITIKRNLPDLEEYDKSIKVIVLGDSSVGKSSLINRLIKNEFAELPATLSLEYHSYIISLNEYSIRMQIWDTAGQEKFNSIINNYYKGTEVGIFLYSIEKEDSFTNVKKWFDELKENIGENSVNILLGNKSDLEEEKRVVTFDQGEDFAKKNGFYLFREISCKSDNKDEVENIMEVFDEIGKHFYEFYKCRRNATSSADMNYVATESMIAIGEKQRNKQNKPKKKSKCC